MLLLLGMKILVLGMGNALAVWAAVFLYSQHEYRLLILLLVGILLIDLTFIPAKAYPLRYILPGALFMLAMVVYPLLHTVNIAFTNYGTGHILNKEQVIEQLQRRYYEPEDPMTYSYQAFVNEKNQSFILLLEDDRGRLYLGSGGQLEPIDLNDPRLQDTTLDQQIDTIQNHTRLEQREIFGRLNDLEKLVFQEGQEYQIRMISFNQYARFLPRYLYSEEEDTITDVREDILYHSRAGAFRSESGEVLRPGYVTHIGWTNYSKLLSDPRILNPFLRVFIWTFVWATLTVISTFFAGILLATILNDPHIRFRTFYRILLILPYAIPPFISSLVWRGFFNTEFGVINRMLGMVIPWLEHPTFAKGALLLLNLWLGFPYMMLICLGALQSINQEMYEAAVVDGASTTQQFRFITFPLLLTTIAPLLISSFAFNFNNFNVVYLLTEGRPPIAGAGTPAGHTDILITYTYRLAFESGRGTDYGLAAAVTIVIFLIIGIISWFNFRFTGALEEVKENV